MSLKNDFTNKSVLRGTSSGTHKHLVQWRGQIFTCLSLKIFLSSVLLLTVGDSFIVRSVFLEQNPPDLRHVSPGTGRVSS